MYCEEYNLRSCSLNKFFHPPFTSPLSCIQIFLNVRCSYSTNTVIFWVTTPCIFICNCRCFGRTCCFQLQERRNFLILPSKLPPRTSNLIFSALKMKTTGPCETLATANEANCRNNTEDHNLNFRLRENSDFRLNLCYI
jgi:hypothetical protein